MSLLGAVPVAEAELERVGLTVVEGPNREHAPEVLPHVIAPPEPFVQVGGPRIVGTVERLVPYLDDGAEASDHVFVAAVEAERQPVAERPGLHRVGDRVHDAHAGGPVVHEIGAQGDLAIAIEMPLEGSGGAQGAEVVIEIVLFVEHVLAAGRAPHDPFPRRMESRWRADWGLVALWREVVADTDAWTDPVDALIRLHHAAVRSVREVEARVQTGLRRREVPEIEAPVDARVEVRTQYRVVRVRLVVERLPVPRGAHPEVGGDLQPVAQPREGPGKEGVHV